jgi:hypothetical protein
MTGEEFIDELTVATNTRYNNLPINAMDVVVTGRGFQVPGNNEKQEYSVDIYQLEWYSPRATYTWQQTDSTTGTSPYWSAGTTMYSGDYMYVYSTSVPEYQYDYTKSEYYDRMTLVVKRKDIWAGCDSCDADNTINTYYWYRDEASTIKSYLRYDTVYTNSLLSSSYTFTFPSSTDGFYYGGKYIHYNESDVNAGEYYLATYTVSHDYKTKQVSTGTTTWSIYTSSDGQSGDYYYDYSNQAVRYRSTMDTFVKNFSAGWVKLSIYEFLQDGDTLPTISSDRRWVLIPR